MFPYLLCYTAIAVQVILLQQIGTEWFKHTDPDRFSPF